MTKSKRTLGYGLAAGAAIAATLFCIQSAGAQGGYPISFATLEGKCTQLVMNGDDMSRSCHDTLVNSTHQGGRSGFRFAAKDVAMATFSGIDDQSVIEIERVTVSSLVNKEAPSVTLVASGTCTYSDLHAGAAEIICMASTDKGAFSGSFVTDGRPPRVQKF